MSNIHFTPPPADMQALPRFVERFEQLSYQARLRVAALILQEIEANPGPDPDPDPETIRLTPENEILINRLKAAMLEARE
jgi:hypothetical protein